MTYVDTPGYHDRTNRGQSLLIVLGMVALLGVAGFALMGMLGVVIAAGLAGFLILSVGRASPKLVLKMYKAQPIAATDLPELHRMFDVLVERAELEHRPQLYYVPSKMLNAFATGRGPESVVAVTHGLLQHMNNREIAGVLAHELSHIKHKDVWVMGLADVFSRLTNTMGQIGQLMLLLSLGALLLDIKPPIPMLCVVVLLLAPLGSTLLQLALSRTREYEADLGAVRITGDPAGLASALQKVEKAKKSWLQAVMPGRKIPEPAMLRTHPPTQERVERLMALEGGLDVPVPVSIPELMVNPPRGYEVRRRPRWHVISGLWY